MAELKALDKALEGASASAPQQHAPEVLPSAAADVSSLSLHPPAEVHKAKPSKAMKRREKLEQEEVGRASMEA